MGPPSELTSCLLPDVTVGLAQQTPFYQSLATLRLKSSDSNFCFYWSVIVSGPGIFDLADFGSPNRLCSACFLHFSSPGADAFPARKRCMRLEWLVPQTASSPPRFRRAPPPSCLSGCKHGSKIQGRSHFQVSLCCIFALLSIQNHAPCRST